MFTRNALLGEHNLCFYPSTKLKYNMLFSNLKAGLDQGCSGLYVASEENIEPIQLEMKKFGLETSDPTKLRSITSYQFYAPDGEFHIENALEQLISTLDESLDKGFEGVYISADVSKFFDEIVKKGMADLWLEYERIMDKKTQLPLERMCAYHVDQIKSDDQLFFELIQSHQNTLSTKLELINNEEICKTTIREELDKIVGEQATEYILGYLEKSLKIPRDQILANVVEFNQGLEIILGDGALSIEKHILKKLQNKLEIKI